MEKYKYIAAMCLILTAIAISCKTKFETTKATEVVKTSPPEVERGKVLVYSSCAGCHYNRSVNKFIGNRIDDVPAIVGKVYSANLTKSKSHGMPAKYTDAQLKYLLKTGVSYDGRFIPYMLRPNMADEDLNDIVAYLRSDDPALVAADTTVGHTSYTPLGKTVMGMNAKPLPNNAGIKRPSENEPVALGRYLVDNLACYHCHSKNLTSLNYLHPEQSKGYLEGGFKLKGGQGVEIAAANITPDKATGIGNFSKQDFLKAVKEGQAPDGPLMPPMPKYQMLNDGEVNAIYAYLQTVPPKEHKVKN